MYVHEFGFRCKLSGAIELWRRKEDDFLNLPRLLQVEALWMVWQSKEKTTFNVFFCCFRCELSSAMVLWLALLAAWLPAAILGE
jgi:hypothetical protein